MKAAIYARVSTADQKCEMQLRELREYLQGLLLSALWDAAFDAGLVSFDDDGRPLCAPALTPTAAEALIVHS